MIYEVEEMNQYEIINNTIDYYKILQTIKNANGEQLNKVLEYEIKITRIKLQKFGINLEDLEINF